MDVIMTRNSKAGTAKLGDQACSPIYPHMTTGRLVILVRDQPVHPLGTKSRYGHGHRSADTQDTTKLSNRYVIVTDVFEYL
jgi:hypothetical protein